MNDSSVDTDTHHASTTKPLKLPTMRLRFLLHIVFVILIACFAYMYSSVDVDDDKKIFQVCVLCEPSPITYMSGQASRFRLLFQHLSDHHHETHKLQLVTADVVHPNPPTSCFDDKIPIHYTIGFRTTQYKSLTLSFDATLKTFRVLWPFTTTWENRFDLIHVSSPGFLIVPAILASQIYQIPLLMSYHTHIPIYARSYFRYPWNNFAEVLAWWAISALHYFADLTLVTSPQIAAEFQEHSSSSSSSSISDSELLQVWKKGVDTIKFHPKYRDNTMRNRMSNNNPDDFLLVHIGRLGKEKRLKDLKGILEEINRRRRDHTVVNDDNITRTTRLCIVGSGPEEDFLKNYLQGTDTIFLGRLDGLELSQAFASGDVFVMPSDSETLGFVVLESMASGVPVVAAKAGGPIDLIDDTKTGHLVPTGDVMAFVDRIEALKNDPSSLRRFSIACRRETERWSWYSSMEQIVEDSYPKCVENFTSRRLSQRLLRWMGWTTTTRKSKAS
jgi:sulfoquinovosyltransferase